MQVKQFQISDTNTKRSSRKLPNEYTIKLTIILTVTSMMGIFYELEKHNTHKNTHTHTPYKYLF